MEIGCVQDTQCSMQSLWLMGIWLKMAKFRRSKFVLQSNEWALILWFYFDLLTMNAPTIVITMQIERDNLTEIDELRLWNRDISTCLCSCVIFHLNPFWISHFKLIWIRISWILNSNDIFLSLYLSLSRIIVGIQWDFVTLYTLFRCRCDKTIII